MKNHLSRLKKGLLLTFLACGMAGTALAQEANNPLSASKWLLQFDDLAPEWRPSLPSQWANDKVVSLNAYMSNLLSHQQRSFAINNTKKLLAVPEKSDDFNMFGTQKKAIDKRAKLSAVTDFLAKSRINTSIDNENPAAFTQSSPGLWLSFASHASRAQPLIRWSKLNANDRSKVRSSADFNTLYSLGISAQLQSQMAYNNLLGLLLERTPQGNAQYSKMERQDFQADFRMRDGNDSWRKAMQNAPSQLLARETLFVLAEIRQELHEARKDNERLLASISMMQAQMTEMNMQSMDSIIHKLNNYYK